jgi:two-component system, LytTR family, response regulator LytT
MGNKIKCICLDDELPALKLIESYCHKLDSVLALVGAFNDPVKALKFVSENDVDLTIMDIQMPQLNGVDFYKKLDKNILGIFISANPDFALIAYEIDIIDFILKPATFARFEKAVRKVQDFVELRQKNHENYITVKQDYLSRQIKVSEILYLEGAGEYVKIVTQAKNYMQYTRLKDLEEEFGKFGFIRIHKSFLVPKKNIASAQFNRVTLTNGTELPVGRTYKDGLKK